ncbi:hypothetical protein D3C76_1435450 [compost metagenome]
MDDQVVQILGVMLGGRGFTEAQHGFELALQALGIEGEGRFAVAVEDKVGIDFHDWLQVLRYTHRFGRRVFRRIPIVSSRQAKR